MIERIVSTKSKHELEITYWPTDICNFNCPYCFAGSTEGKYRYPKDLEAELLKFKNLFARYSQLGKTQFNLTIAGGGEPTLWPQLEDFCEGIKQLGNVKINLISNGSRTVSWWERNAKFLDCVILSCHVHEVDIKHHIEVADALFERKINVIAMMVMDSTKWDTCIEYISNMLGSSHLWTIQVKEVVESSGRDINSYNQEQLDYIKQPIKRLEPSDRILQHIGDYAMVESVGLYKDGSAQVANTNKYINGKENHFKDWKCSFPIERIAIAPSGKIKGSCGVEFDINDPAPVICNRESCVCPPDTHVTKTRIV
jgi:organic radical activating enzyme